MNNLWAFTVTHKQVKVTDLGKMIPEHSESEGHIYAQLKNVQEQLGIDELFFLPTCNRILFILHSRQDVDNSFIGQFYQLLHSSERALPVQQMNRQMQIFRGIEVVDHLFSVASSLDSLVVGEREILGQLKQAYENCNKHQLTGDCIRLLMKKTIETAKQVFTQTKIGENPVSVVSLSVENLMSHIRPYEAKVWMIGAGQTNMLAAKLLSKKGFSHFRVFNRSKENAERLGKKLQALSVHQLEDLQNIEKDANVLFVCTGSNVPIITDDILSQLKQKTIIIDLGVPADTAASVHKYPHIQYISIEDLRRQSEINLQKRGLEVEAAKEIVVEQTQAFQLTFRKRNIEKALSPIPQKVSAIKERAYNEVFSKEIAQLDPQSKEVMDKVVAYLQKKYISIPMTIAKKALEDELGNDHYKK